MSKSKKQKKVKNNSNEVDHLEGKKLLADDKTELKKIIKKKKKQQVEQAQTTIDCFKEVRVDMPLHLPPAFIGSILLGVVQKLGTYLLKYSPEVDGVILAFWGEKLLQAEAYVLADTPHMHFKITCNLLVFSPSIGSKLVGVVNQVGFDYIGLHLLGIFPVKISSRHLPPSFVRDVEADCWTRSATNETIQEGTKILFTVVDINKSVDGYSISGSMEGEGTGIVVDGENCTLILHQFENIQKLLATSDQRTMIRKSLSLQNLAGDETGEESFSEYDQPKSRPQPATKVKAEPVVESPTLTKKKRKRSSSSSQQVAVPAKKKKTKK